MRACVHACVSVCVCVEDGMCLLQVISCLLVENSEGILSRVLLNYAAVHELYT